MQVANAVEEVANGQIMIQILVPPQLLLVSSCAGIEDGLWAGDVHSILIIWSCRNIETHTIEKV